MEVDSSPQQIDIGSILYAKAGRRLPIVLRYLVERLIHQREINEILMRYRAYEGVDFMNRLIEYFDVDISWSNPEALPDRGRKIFVSNHPLGGFDGICLSHLIGRHYGDVRYIVNDLLYHLRPLQPIFLPVNKYGSQARASVDRMQDALESDLPIVTFPAGLCSRHIDGKIQDTAWAKSFVRQAVQYKRDVVPIYFEGRNSWHFYALERLRRSLGVGFNVGTVLLPDEMFRAKGKAFTATVGEAISWQDIANSLKKPESIALEIRNRCYALGAIDS